MTRDAAGVLARLADGVALRPMGDSSEFGTPPLELEAVLRRSLALSGTVRIADHLASRSRTPLRGPEAPVSPIRQTIARSIGEARGEVDTAFADPFHGRRAMPSADVVDRMLRSANAFESRDPAAIREVGKNLAAQARERFDHHLGKGRQRIRWIRADVASELRSLGSRAASLEALDAVLERSLESAIVTRHRALETRLDDVFITRFTNAVLALPEDATDVASLYSRGGMMPRYAADLRELLAAILETELDAVLALIDTAHALRNQEALA